MIIAPFYRRHFQSLAERSRIAGPSQVDRRAFGTFRDREKVKDLHLENDLAHASSAGQRRLLQLPLQRLFHADSCENTHVRCQDEFFKMIQDDAPCLLR